MVYREVGSSIALLLLLHNFGLIFDPCLPLLPLLLLLQHAQCVPLEPTDLGLENAYSFQKDLIRVPLASAFNEN